MTSVAKWTSSVPTVAQVSSSGLVTAFAAGQTNITAAFREVSGTADNLGEHPLGDATGSQAAPAVSAAEIA
jgi:uncharacterized protein YjdB